MILIVFDSIVMKLNEQLLNTFAYGPMDGEFSKRESQRFIFLVLEESGGESYAYPMGASSLGKIIGRIKHMKMRAARSKTMTRASMAKFTGTFRND